MAKIFFILNIILILKTSFLSSIKAYSVTRFSSSIFLNNSIPADLLIHKQKRFVTPWRIRKDNYTVYILAESASVNPTHSAYENYYFEVIKKGKSKSQNGKRSALTKRRPDSTRLASALTGTALSFTQCFPEHSGQTTVCRFFLLVMFIFA